jgi:hypothetical protein
LASNVFDHARGLWGLCLIIVIVYNAGICNRRTVQHNKPEIAYAGDE